MVVTTDQYNVLERHTTGTVAHTDLYRLFYPFIGVGWRQYDVITNLVLSCLLGQGQSSPKDRPP